MSDRDPLEGISPDRLAWHQGALEGDAVVCAAVQPGRPGFPCILNKLAHDRHEDVRGRRWPFRSVEPLRVARRACFRLNRAT